MRHPLRPVVAFLFLLLVVVLLPSARVHAAPLELVSTWSHPTPQGNPIYGLCFADDLRGWAVARGGAILGTVDGGDTWTVLRAHAPDDGDLLDVVVTDDGALVACGSDGRILRSTDDGVHWSRLSTSATGQLRDLAVRPDGALVAVGEDGVVLISADEGRTWTDRGPGVGTADRTLWRSASEGYVVGLDLAHRTRDGGATWEEFLEPDFLGMTAILTPSADTIVVFHSFGQWRSDDGGTTWSATERFQPPFYQFRAVALDADHWITASNGEGGDVWETTDGGQTWSRLLYRDTGGFPSMVRLPSGRLVIGSDIGDLLVSDDDGLTFTNRAVNLAGDDVFGQAALVARRADGVVFAAVGNAGAGWIRSADGGRTWTVPRQAPPLGVRRGGAFHDDRIGVVWGPSSMVRTDDGGETWEDVSLPPGSNFRRLSGGADLGQADRFLLCTYDESAGDGGLLASRDAGVTWELVTDGLPAGLDARVVSIGADGTGFLAANEGPVARMYRTADGGRSWVPVSWLHGQVYALEHVGDVVFVGTGGALRRSVDGGLTWPIVSPESTTQVEFHDADHGIARAFGTTFRLTRDGGDTWEVHEVPFRGLVLDRPVYAFVFDVLALPDESQPTWLVGGEQTRMLRVSTARSTDATPPAPDRSPDGPRIDDVRPNPFNPRVEVRFRVDHATEVELTVHDARGRRVRTLGRSTWPAGRHDVVWDGRDDTGQDVASGVYHLAVRSRAGRATAKLVLVR